MKYTRNTHSAGSSETIPAFSPDIPKEMAPWRVLLVILALDFRNTPGEAAYRAYQSLVRFVDIHAIPALPSGKCFLFKVPQLLDIRE
jgi:hypothetical protein